MNDPSLDSTAPAGAPEAAPPAPTFDALPLSSDLRETLAEIGYVNPTPVQLAVWDPATRGKDVVVQARTGTGKTAAFGLPIVDHVVKRSVAAVQVLCLCPTRELAVQVSGEIERLGKRRGVRVVAIYGGAPMPRQVDQIAGGAQVVVGTPGRVLDHIRRGTLDTKGIRLLTLDEADEMLSMGFERELTAILDTLPADRQTLLFSATLPPDIERIARSRLKQPEFVTLSGDHVGALSILHFVYMVAGDKLGALARVIEVENPESAVVFCNTKDETERVAQSLCRQGYEADWLNGDLPQSEREKVMVATREGKLRFLVATDVAARGIDISHLTHVINFDFPQDAEAYVHRTGRTGRAGRTGTAISLIAPRDIGGLYLLRLTYKIRPIERQIPSAGELKTRAEADLVTMLTEAFLSKPIHADDLALARRLLSHDRAESIVAGLLRDHLGVRPSAQDEAAAARRAKAPRPIQTRDERWRAAKQAEQAGRVARNESAPQTSADAPAETERRGGAVPEERAARPTEGSRSRRDKPRGGAERDRPENKRERGPRPDAGRPAPSLPRPAGPRHADFVTWQPPEEEGDDQPILAGARAQARSAESAPAATVTEVEIFVNVGRRDGARAADLQRALVEQASLERDTIGRIRVRERNAFVSVRREHLDRAIAALTGLTVGEKTTTAELARGRGGADEAGGEA